MAESAVTLLVIPKRAWQWTLPKVSFHAAIEILHTTAIARRNSGETHYEWRVEGTPRIAVTFGKAPSDFSNPRLNLLCGLLQLNQLFCFRPILVKTIQRIAT